MNLRKGMIDVTDGFKEKADLRIESDSEQWLKIINKEISGFGMLMLLLTRRMRIRGNRKLLRKFQSVYRFYKSIEYLVRIVAIASNAG